MKILISNDDGYRSEGIQSLFKVLSDAGHETIMFAPDRERSTISHAITLHKPLRVLQVKERQYILNGTPADCIFVGLRYLRGWKPDMIISGVNRGANLGTDVHYSGTVSCAREAVLSGYPAMAVSLVLDHFNTPEEKEAYQAQQHYDTAARVVVDLLPKVIELKKFPKRLLNLNAPNVSYEKLKGVRLCFLGNRIYSGELDRRTDPRGREYLWAGGVYEGYTSQNGSDNDWIAEGFATLTPVTLDVTDFSLMKEMEMWGLQRED